MEQKLNQPWRFCIPGKVAIYTYPTFALNASGGFGFGVNGIAPCRLGQTYPRLPRSYLHDYSLAYFPLSKKSGVMKGGEVRFIDLFFPVTSLHSLTLFPCCCWRVRLSHA